jgi:DNA-binding response OmpR family regulator/tetratricopeptide (TPR) repeat protein
VPPQRSRTALRVLLVTQSEDELRTFGLSLHRERFAVTRACDLAGAVAALRGAKGFDAALVSHPLPDADVIASCAALRQVPGAPPLILLDALDPNEQTFPAAIRPARLLRKPIDAAKLGELVREVVDGADEREEAPPPAANAGPLAFAGELLQLSRTRETGVLEVRTGSIRMRVFVQAGAVVSAEGGSLRETLGRMLLRRGDLAEADYVRVIERMTERVMANEHQRMGEVLVELGLLSHDEVHRALEAQVSEKVSACFGWADASWSFSELDALPDDLEPFTLPPAERLVYAGLREHAPPAAVAAWLRPHAKEKPRLRRRLGELQALFALDGAALREIERLDGTRALGSFDAHDGPLQALLATLMLCDAIELDPNAPPVVQRKLSHPREVVGRRKSGGTAQPVDAPAVPTAAEPRAQSRLEAEQCFRRAQQLLAADKPIEAAKLLRQAVDLEPGEPEYAMLEAWVSYLEARQSVRISRARAITAARRMLESDPKAPRVHTILGRLALDEGDRTRATREFELALLRDPQDEEAKKGLKQLRG